MTAFLGRVGWLSGTFSLPPVTDEAWYALAGPWAARETPGAWAGNVIRHILLPPAQMYPDGDGDLRLVMRGQPTANDTEILEVRACTVPLAQETFDVGPDGWSSVLFGGVANVTIGQDAEVRSDTFTLAKLGTTGHEGLLVSIKHNTGIHQAGWHIPGWRMGFLITTDVEAAGAFAPYGTLNILQSVEGFTLPPEPHPSGHEHFWVGAGDWVRTGEESGWNNYTIRNLIKSPALTGVSGKSVRFRYSGRTTAINAGGVHRAAVSTVPAAQTNFNVGSGGWVPITFGGRRFGPADTDGENWSDPVFLPNFGDTSHEALVVSTYIYGNFQGRATNATGWTTAYLSGDQVESASAFTTYGTRVTLTGLQSTPAPAVEMTAYNSPVWVSPAYDTMAVTSADVYTAAAGGTLSTQSSDVWLELEIE